MDILQLLLYRDLPESFMQTYGRFIRKRKRLHNGWHAVSIRNGYMFLLHATYEDFCVPAVKKIYEAKDGKFMLKLRGGKKIIYRPNGTPLTSFSKLNKLYPNGWYQSLEDGKFSLYDAQETCIATNLRKVKVFENGMYHTVDRNGVAHLAGIAKQGKKQFLRTDNKKVAAFSNGWFVVGNTLYDNFGRAFLEPLPMRKVPFWMLCIVGRMMKREPM